MTLRRTFLFLTAGVVLAAPVTAQTTPPKREPLPATPPDSLRADLDVVYGQTKEQVLKMDVYRPKAASGPLPACVLVHGGGWVKGDKERFRPLAIALAQRGYVVANVEYRLGPVAKYPAAVQDCSLAVRYVRAHAAELGADPNRIGAWGGSAGGHLVGVLAGAPEYKAFLTEELAGVSAAVQATCVMAGPTDLTSPSFTEPQRKKGAESYTFQWLGSHFDDAPGVYREAAPLTHFTRTTGPILFLTGDQDNPERDHVAMAKLKTLGVPTDQVVLKDAKHGCWNQQPWFDQCVDAVDKWFKTYLVAAGAAPGAPVPAGQ